VVGVSRLIPALILSLVGLSCGPRVAPRIEVPAEHTDQAAYREAYAAFWWNCAIVKSIDLGARCPNTCTGAPAAIAGCSAGAGDAETRIAELERKYGSARTRELLSMEIGEKDGYSNIQPHFPYGPKSATGH
jgi:hypothetical protein